MRFTTLFLAFITALLFASCSSKPVETMRVGSVLWPGYEPLYVARSLDYYKDKHIKLIDYLSNTDAMRAFKNGALEACAFTLDEALLLIDENIEIEIILIMDISHGGDVILANPSIKSMKALKGKRLGIEANAVGAYVGNRALEIAGIDKSELNIISILASEAAHAFENNQIDAAVTFDPHRSKLLKMGKHEIFSSKSLPNEVIDVLVVRKSYLRDYPEVVQTLINGWFKALNFSKKEPLKMANMSAKRQHTTPEEYLQSLTLLKFPTPTENKLLLDATKSSLVKSSVKLFNVLQTFKSLKHKEINIKPYLNHTFIP